MTIQRESIKYSDVLRELKDFVRENIPHIIDITIRPHRQKLFFLTFFKKTRKNLKIFKNLEHRVSNRLSDDKQESLTLLLKKSKFKDFKGFIKFLYRGEDENLLRVLRYVVLSMLQYKLSYLY